jgi:hypothetical protein
MLKIREKRILGIAVGKHRVFPVTRHGYSSSAKEVARVPLKKMSDARCKPSKMQIAVPSGFMNRRIPATIATVLCVLSPSANAYDRQLDSHAIHEAYILGQRNDKSTGDFLAPYLTQITEPQNDVHIAQIELLTPFAQIVDVCRQKSSDRYTEDQAIQEYKAHGNTVKVNVTLMLPSAYPKAAESKEAPTPAPATGSEKSAMSPENFWQNFQFNLKQNGKTIPSRGISNQPIHSTATNNAPAVLTGENVWLEYDVNDVASELTTMEVVTPQGKVIKATFDLKKLR